MSSCATDQGIPDAHWMALECQPIADAWFGAPLDYDVATQNGQQIVAFYAPNQQLRVAQRELGTTDWRFVRLDTEVPWDPHRYITMTIDANGEIHLSANHHNDILKYWKSAEALDITTLERTEMVGEDEGRVTYPHFFEGPNDSVLFRYRDGVSGSGVNLYNQYDPESREWSRFLETPLTDGTADGFDMSAYARLPKRGPDGNYHITWMWRNSGNAETCHDISYARSEDMQNWESAAGVALDLPITPADIEQTVIDPVPVEGGGGMVNISHFIGFDTQGRVISSYHKFDDDGNTQAYNARLEGGEWEIYQTSQWDYRWDFGGVGSLSVDVKVYPVTVQNGQLTQRFEHVEAGKGMWILDEETLEPTKTVRLPQYSSSVLGEKDSTIRIDPTADVVGGEPAVDGWEDLRLDSGDTAASWIWYPEFEDKPNRGSLSGRLTRYFRRTVDLSGDRRVAAAMYIGSADSTSTVYAAGESVGSSDSWQDVTAYNLTRQARENDTLAVGVEATRNPAGPPFPVGWAGVVGRLAVWFENGDTMVVDTDDSWRASKSATEGWADATFEDSEWESAKVYGTYPTAPWKVLNYPYTSTPMTTHYPAETVTESPADTVPELRYQLFYRSLDYDPPSQPELDPTSLELKTMVGARNLEMVSFSAGSPIDPEGNDQVPVEVSGDVSLDSETVTFGQLDALVMGEGAEPASADGATMRFPVSETGLQEGDTAYLRGVTTGGTPVIGREDVTYE